LSTGFFSDLSHKPEKNSGALKKNSGVKERKFLQALKKTLIYQDLDFQKSRCRIIG
jgi:hypothetical protein